MEELDPFDPGPKLFKGSNGSCGAEQGLRWLQVFARSRPGYVLDLLGGSISIPDLGGSISSPDERGGKKA